MSEETVLGSTVVLSLQCDDQPGIVATVTSMFADNGLNIVESSIPQERE